MPDPDNNSIKAVNKVFKAVAESPTEAFADVLNFIKELANSADRANMPEDFAKVATMGPALAVSGFVSKTEVSVALYQLGIRHGRAQATPAG